jgi:hypothetical protein
MMATPAANIERERLLKLAEEYRERGYEVSFHPNVEEGASHFCCQYKYLDNYRAKLMA